MNDLEKVRELDIKDLIKGLTESQTIMNYAFAGFKTEVETKFNEVNTRIDEHDTMIKKKIQITPNEAKNINDRVKQKVKEICENNGLEYHKVKSKVFPRVWREIKNKNHVATYRELPSFHFEDIMQDIQNLNIYVQDIKAELETENA